MSGTSCSLAFRACPSIWPIRLPRSSRSIRRLDLKKPPSISEAIDWARTLVLLGAGSISREQTPETLHVLLKYEADIEKARVELAGGGTPQAGKPFVDDFRRREEPAE